MQYTRTFIHLLTIPARIKLKLNKVVRFRKAVVNVLRFVQRAIKDHWFAFFEALLEYKTNGVDLSSGEAILSRVESRSPVSSPVPRASFSRTTCISKVSSYR